MIAPLVAALLLAASGAPDPGGFALADPRIDEASALVALPDGLFATTNDSGDTGRVFVLDDRGRTVGLTRWEAHPRDVEALAPAPGAGELWVGDIGDNAASRPHVQVARVPVGRGERSVHPTVYTLVYPDGAHDAETLLCDPTTGRLYIASKNWFGGTLYAAPTHLVAGRDNPMTAVGAVLPMATDGVFLPGGRTVLIRGYVSATTYAWPSMDRIASFALPRQPQGEGVGVRPDGAVYLSSEGLHSRVLRFTLPARATGTRSASGAATPSGGVGTSSGPGTSAPGARASSPARPWWPWGLGGVAGLAIIAVLGRSLRRR